MTSLFHKNKKKKILKNRINFLPILMFGCFDMTVDSNVEQTELDLSDYEQSLFEKCYDNLINVDELYDLLSLIIHNPYKAIKLVNMNIISNLLFYIKHDIRLINIGFQSLYTIVKYNSLLNNNHEFYVFIQESNELWDFIYYQLYSQDGELVYQCLNFVLLFVERFNNIEILLQRNLFSIIQEITIEEEVMISLIYFLSTFDFKNSQFLIMKQKFMEFLMNNICNDELEFDFKKLIFKSLHNLINIYDLSNELVSHLTNFMFNVDISKMINKLLIRIIEIDTKYSQIIEQSINIDELSGFLKSIYVNKEIIQLIYLIVNNNRENTKLFAIGINTIFEAIILLPYKDLSQSLEILYDFFNGLNQDDIEAHFQIIIELMLKLYEMSDSNDQFDVSLIYNIFVLFNEIFPESSLELYGKPLEIIIEEINNKLNEITDDSEYE